VLLHSSFELLLGAPCAHFSCVKFCDDVQTVSFLYDPLKDLSEVGESVVRHRCSWPLKIELVFDALDSMVMLVGFDQSLHHPIQK